MENQPIQNLLNCTIENGCILLDVNCISVKFSLSVSCLWLHQYALEYRFIQHVYTPGTVQALGVNDEQNRCVAYVACLHVASRLLGRDICQRITPMNCSSTMLTSAKRGVSTMCSNSR